MNRRSPLLFALTLLAACQDDYLVPSPPLPAVAGRPFEPPPAGFTRLERNDWGCDGTTEICVWSLYDMRGQLRSQREGYSANCGVLAPTGCTRWWLRADGARVTAEEPGCDGVLVQCKAERTLEHSVVVELDRDCNGVLDFRQTTQRETYNAGGFFHQEWLSTSPPRCSYTGVILAADGRRLGYGEDEGCDGSFTRCDLNSALGIDAVLALPEGASCRGHVETCHRFEQREEARGIWTFTAQDPTCAGALHSCRSTLHDREGNLLYESTDLDCDGQKDSCSTRTLTRDGDLTELHITTDEGCDGAPSSCERVIYRGDELLLDDDDFGCDGQNDLCFHTTLNDQGQRVMEWVGCDAPSQCSTTRYDAAGRVIYEDFSIRCAPQPDHCFIWRYDTAGDLVSKVSDEGCDGTPDHCTETIPFP